MERHDIEYKLYGIKSRFDERQRARVDADDKEKGEWITTSTGVHIHLNEEGVADKGPKGAVDAINEKDRKKSSSSKKGEKGYQKSGEKSNSGESTSNRNPSPKGSVSKNYKVSPIDTMTDKDFDGDIEMKKFASAVLGEAYPDANPEDFSVSVRKGWNRSAKITIRYKDSFPDTFSIEEYHKSSKDKDSKCLVCVRNGYRIKDPVLVGDMFHGARSPGCDYDKQKPFKP